MEVWRIMIAVVHLHDNTEEPADLRHRLSISSRTQPLPPGTRYFSDSASASVAASDPAASAWSINSSASFTLPRGTLTSNPRLGYCEAPTTMTGMLLDSRT